MSVFTLQPLLKMTSFGRIAHLREETAVLSAVRALVQFHCLIAAMVQAIVGLQ